MSAGKRGFERRDDFAQQGWTEDRLALCKRLYIDEGRSATHTAQALGGITPMAVIGKARRMGWTRTAEVARQNASLNGRRYGRFVGIGFGSQTDPAASRNIRPVRASKQVSAAARGQVQKIKAGPSVAPEPFTDTTIRPGEVGTVPLMQLGALTCRWPIGDPASPSFGFCGARCDAEAAYCSGHARIAYQPSEKKQSTRDLTRSLRRHYA